MNEHNEEYDEYDDDEYYNYDYPKSNPNQWYFTFDTSPNNPISSWIMNIFNDLGYSLGQPIPGFPLKKFPVNSWNPNTVNDKFQYLGSNYDNEAIIKSKYFVIDSMHIQYTNHLKSHASHFLRQPLYYKGMFDILN